MMQRNTLTAAERKARRQQAKEKRAAKKEMTRAAGMDSENKPMPTALLAEYKALRYDYGLVSQQHRRTVQDAAVDIRRREKRAVEDMFAIGRRLVEVKDLLPHGEFEKWIVIEFDYSLTFARQLMNVDRRLGSKSTLCVVLGTSIIRLLSAPTVPDEALDVVLELANSRGKAPTIIEVQQIIQRYQTHVLEQSPAPRMIEMKAETPAVAMTTTEPPVPQLTGTQRVTGDTVGSSALTVPQVSIGSNEITIDAEYTVVAPALTLAEWWAMMPKGEMTLRDWLLIFETAKVGATYVREGRPALNLSVGNFLVPVSQLIHAIEKELKK